MTAADVSRESKGLSERDMWLKFETLFGFQITPELEAV
jgi:hypothetical protein